MPLFRCVRNNGVEPFGVSEACYRYQPKLDSENAETADWLARLTEKESDLYF